jgi:hypothetical protein
MTNNTQQHPTTPNNTQQHPTTPNNTQHSHKQASIKSSKTIAIEALLSHKTCQNI